MEIVRKPIPPWHIIIVLLTAGAVGFLLVRGTFDRWRAFGRTRKTRFAVLALSVAAAALFAAASFNPHYMRGADVGGMHLVVAVDVSDSVLRADGGWQRVQAQAHELIAFAVSATPGQVLRQSTASILTFGKSVVVADHKIGLADLPNAFNGLNRGDFAIGEESDIGAGLAWAGKLIERAGGRGAILLISDGHQTVGDALEEAEHLARRGIAIHVHPVKSRSPELAIAAADLPYQVNAGVETFMRGVLRNDSGDEAHATLTLSQNPGLEEADRFGPPMTSETTVSIPPHRWARFRQSITFQGAGLQYVELTLVRDDGGGQHRRRFFTHVNRPPQILAVGGDERWVTALSSVGYVTPIHPGDFPGEISLGDLDAIVVNSVPAHQFSDGALDVISKTIEQDGVGLLLLNGDHQGVDDETETVLMSYADTALEPLLPVSSTPLQEPPARQVVIMIDASGSMSGWPVEKAKQIARHIVENLLWDKDQLDVITFTIDASHLVQDRAMDDNGKRYAVGQIGSIAASGGTDPSTALALIAERKMINCNLIFISDGKFDHVAERPDCQITVFAIGGSVPAGSPLRDLANPIPVDVSFDPTRIDDSFLDPVKKPFMPGEFVPWAMNEPVRRGDDLPVPDLPLQGTATTYVKLDADLVAVRPKLANPVLAYRESGNRCVGVLTTAVPPSWLESEEGRHAVEAWITHVMPYAARDRYDFRLVDHGDTIEVRISLVVRQGTMPEVDSLDAAIEIPREAPIGIKLSANSDAAATFSGRVRVSRDTRAQSATLILTESGADALSRPQRIPLLIPPAATVETALLKEAHSYGLDESLLREIAESSGGVFDLANGTPFFRGKTVENQGKPLWPWLAIAAASCYLGAIALRRLEL